MSFAARRFEFLARCCGLGLSGRQRLAECSALCLGSLESGPSLVAGGSRSRVPRLQVFQPLQLRGGRLLFGLPGGKDLRRCPSDFERADQVFASLRIGIVSDLPLDDLESSACGVELGEASLQRGKPFVGLARGRFRSVRPCPRIILSAALLAGG